MGSLSPRKRRRVSVDCNPDVIGNWSLRPVDKERPGLPVIISDIGLNLNSQSSGVYSQRDLLNQRTYSWEVD